ncbi:RNA-directed DNA polymerase, eukaryota [Tanacetum coccineum]
MMIVVKIMEGFTIFDSKDRWRWSLEGCGEFTVASVRNLLDANSLRVVSSKTRWIKAVPIKVNVHAWKVKLDILPTRLNISKRGMDIESILCPLCEKNVESSSHIFFTCPISREIFRKVLLWWQIDVVMVSSYDEWLEWLLSIQIAGMIYEVLGLETDNWFDDLRDALLWKAENDNGTMFKHFGALDNVLKDIKSDCVW